MKRQVGPFVLGGSLLLAGVFLLLVLPGCQVGWTDPDAAGNRKAGLLLPLATASDAVNSGVGTVFDAIGGWVGLSGLGGVGAVIAGLTRGWAKAREQAASATTAKVVGDAEYEAGRERAHAARDRADNAFTEGMALASARGPVPMVPVANATTVEGS